MVKKKVVDFLYEKESYEIRGACFDVYKTFGGAFKEKVVDRALTKSLEKRGLKVEEQKRIDIYFEDEKVGTYVPDKIINECILLELKAKSFLTKQDIDQFWKYLRGLKYKLAFLINFGPSKLAIKRVVYDKARYQCNINQRKINQRNISVISAFRSALNQRAKYVKNKTNLDNHHFSFTAYIGFS